MADWLRGGLREVARELLFSSRATARGYARPERVLRLWRSHQQKTQDHSAQLWALMVLELWHRTFIDQPPTGPVTP